MDTMQMQMEFGDLANGRFDRTRDEVMAARLSESPTGEDRLMEMICERENMLKALKRVESPGVDGMKTTQLRGYVRRHGEKIKAALLEGTHKPFPVRRAEIPKEGGGVRLLANIVLDELDKELEKRGLRFVRYADDVAIYVRSLKAAERVKGSVSRFITRKLRLVVNEEKSEVNRPWHSKYLGFRITRFIGQTRIGVHAKSLRRFRERVREITARKRGRSLAGVVGELNALLRGWVAYFSPGLSRTLARELDHWIRRRLRAYVWKQWPLPRTQVQNLKARDVRHPWALMVGNTRKGAWRLSKNGTLCTALPDTYFTRSLGLVLLGQLCR